MRRVFGRRAPYFNTLNQNLIQVKARRCMELVRDLAPVPKLAPRRVALHIEPSLGICCPRVSTTVE